MVKSLAEIPVLILVGGKGTRLSAVVSDVPKPMAPIEGKPFLEFVLSHLHKSGFRKIVLLTGYMAETISGYFGSGEKWGLNIHYSHESQPLGTGGAIRQAMLQGPAPTSLVLNGDTFYNIDYQEFVSRSNAKVSIALHHVPSVSRYGAVQVDPEGYVTAFTEKNSSAQAGEINAGIYLVDRSLAAEIPDGFVSLETDIFPHLVQKQQVQGVSMRGQFIDIGIPEDYSRAQREVPQWIR
jgi:D-glycero-alpha-D-manno-heptose 1-phosphate guanylyltransferase